MMKKAFRYFLTVLAALVILNLFMVPLIEPGMIYFPVKELGRNPASLGLEYEDVFLKTGDGNKIHGWFIKNRASKKVVLLFHGNGGNISHRLPMLRLLHGLPASVFIIDYHGYGRSEGRPSEQNLYLDGGAAYDYLIRQKKYSASSIILYGSSLGGAVAVDLAAQEKVGGVILESTFTSARDMARRMSVFYRWPIVWIRSRFDSLEKIDSIKAPLLVIHSKEDEMVPYQMALALYERATEPKRLLLLERGGHNDFIMTAEFIKSLKETVK
jgi:fermentation-respiration switch protein FrsA (DUF1100 family)